MNQTHVAKLKSSKIARLSAASLLMLVLGCSSKKEESPSKDSKIEQPTEECLGDGCAANAPAVDWNSKSPTYSANLRVVDAFGQPISDALVLVGKRMSKTNSEGRVRVSQVEATTASRVRIEKSGQTPTVTRTSAWKSGHATQEVGLVPIGQEKDFDGEKALQISDGDAKVDVGPRTLAGADGARTKAGKAQVTYIDPDKTQPHAVPASKAALDETGSPTAIKDLLGVLYVHFSDAANQPLNLAPGQIARIDFPVPNKARKKEGDTIPLWSLDEQSGEWKKESACKVEKRKVGEDAELACAGTVSHFSYWALATEVDIYEPGSLGCLNTQTTVEPSACFKAAAKRQTIYTCDAKGENCSISGPAREVFLPASSSDPNWCSVLETEQTYRVQLVYDVDASGCQDLPEPPVSGRRTMLTDPFSLDTFADSLGSELMLNFTLNGARDCGTLCQQVPFEIKLSDLESPVWIDHDNDGYFNAPEGEGTFVPGIPIDCNDDDANTHPGAWEVFCIEEDLNCDGITNKSAKVYSDVSSPYMWNRFCKMCAAIEGSEVTFSEEQPGNLYDEDCDGKVDDRDSDGSSSPEDCNDFDPASNPKGTEVFGNYADENCDGAALDADDDGMFASYHIVFAEKLELNRELFVDCDDFDPAANPKANAADEAGALYRFYYRREEQLRRRTSYCNLFFQDGSPSWLYHHIVKDLNCDGRVTDADGDGFAAAGDNSLGAELATDCDDLDPRVTPMSSEDSACVVRADLPNDSVCEVRMQSPGEGCPVLTLSGTVLPTACEESKQEDGTGTGVGVCSFAGWWDGNPLSINPGTVWGPCDDGSGLDACPVSAQCGGPLPYTDAFTSYLSNAYLKGAAPRFKGMCFPVCAIP